MDALRLKIARCVLALLAASALGSASANPVIDTVRDGDGAALAAALDNGADVDAAEPDGSTALHWAVHGDDPEAVRALLEAGADPSARTRTDITPLYMAAEVGDATLIGLLLDAGADANERFAHGETPLMMAARTGRVDAIDTLVAAGAEVDAAEDLRGTTALMWAAAYSNPDAVAALIGHGADLSMRSKAVPRGREPYLAPSARERIDEFLEGTGLRGAALDFDVDEDGNPVVPRSDPTEETAAEEGAAAAEGDNALAEEPADVADAEDDGAFGRGRQEPADGGGLTALVFAAREGDMDSARLLLEAGADVNQTTQYGWTPLLTAVQNRSYKLAAMLLEHGADPSIQNDGGWSPLYIATDNRNIEGGDYPTRRPDMEHFELIERLLEYGADPNARMESSTETRTIFTHQWLYEHGATPFLRAAQSSDTVLMNLLLEHGADPSIATYDNVTPLMVASGIGWVEGVTYEWSEEQNVETVNMLIELGADVNAQDTLDHRTALMGAAHKGRPEIVQILVDHGADLAARDIGSRDSIHALAGVTWQAIDYADGLVRVGVQSAIAHPETAALIRRLMEERGLEVPPAGRTLDSICITEVCK
jgi:ankyrin repeat protein